VCSSRINAKDLHLSRDDTGKLSVFFFGLSELMRETFCWPVRAVIASRVRYLARFDFVLYSAEQEFDRSKPHLK